VIFWTRHRLAAFCGSSRCQRTDPRCAKFEKRYACTCRPQLQQGRPLAEDLHERRGQIRVYGPCRRRGLGTGADPERRGARGVPIPAPATTQQPPTGPRLRPRSPGTQTSSTRWLSDRRRPRGLRRPDHAIATEPSVALGQRYRAQAVLPPSRQQSGKLRATVARCTHQIGPNDSAISLGAPRVVKASEHRADVLVALAIAIATMG
jgi:hypothetical protein